MESQVQELLNEERKVNSQVKQALQTKREKLATITQHTERAVANERRELQDELNQKIEQVSIGRPVSFRCHGDWLLQVVASHGLFLISGPSVINYAIVLF